MCHQFAHMNSVGLYIYIESENWVNKTKSYAQAQGNTIQWHTNNHIVYIGNMLAFVLDFI